MEVSQKEIVNNMKHCTSFDKCSQNFCPLDFELELRVGSTKDNCRYMREPRQTKINGKSFVSGGKPMPEEALKFVPKSNVSRLNTISRKSWEQIKNQKLVKPL